MNRPKRRTKPAPAGPRSISISVRLKKYPLAPEAATAQYRVAELLEASGDLSRAFNAYQALLTKYPDTPNFERAVAAQVTIANKYLQGRPQKFLGVSVGNSAKRAQEMYTNILANAPFSKYAPIAQFNLGLAYEKQSVPFDAIKAYQKVLDTYPTATFATMHSIKSATSICELDSRSSRRIFPRSSPPAIPSRIF